MEEKDKYDMIRKQCEELMKIARENNLVIMTATQIPTIPNDYIDYESRRRNKNGLDLIIIDHMSLLK